MTWVQYCIARRYAQLKLDPQAKLSDVLLLEPIVKLYEEREKEEEESA